MGGSPKSQSPDRENRKKTKPPKKRGGFFILRKFLHFLYDTDQLNALLALPARFR
jgi:hypothetical protein